MKFVLLSDPHLRIDQPVARLDDVAETVENKFVEVVLYAVATGYPLLIAGDVFDMARSWKLLWRYMKFLRGHSGSVRIFVVAGQHDLFMGSPMSRPFTNLGILAESGLVWFLGSESMSCYESGPNPIRIWGASYGEPVPEFKKIKGVKDILVIHQMISNRPPWPGADFISARKFLEEHPNYDLIHCGDAHILFKETIGKRVIFNSGPMLRAEATEDMYAHCPGFGVWNSMTGEVELVSIDHRPAKEVLSREHLTKKKELDERMRRFTGELSHEGIDAGVSFTDNLRAFMVKEGISDPVRDLIFGVMGEEAKGLAEAIKGSGEVPGSAQPEEIRPRESPRPKGRSTPPARQRI